MFDVQPSENLVSEWDVDFPIEDVPDWQIGLIVGPSGSGKTTLAKKIFGEGAYHRGFQWSGNSMLDDFPEGVDVKTITKALSSVGFSSPPAWLKPFHVLSNGQQFRSEVARLMLEPGSDLVVVDEWTSVIDRQVAKFSCAAVEKYIRASPKKLVCVSCHDDIIEWLRPDWIYRVDTNSFSSGRLLRRPPINLSIQRVHHSAWELFKGLHYLSKDIQKSSHVYVASWEGKPVSLFATIAMPHDKVKNGWRGHRIVVMSDYQGLGIGSTFVDIMADYYCRELGKRFFAMSAHPGLNSHERNSPLWMLTRAAGMVGKPQGVWTSASTSRLTERFEYVGHVPERQALIEEWRAKKCQQQQQS